MNKVVLADTGPLYALADPSDQFHVRAAAELETIEKRGYTVAASYATLCEAYTLVLRRLSVAYARQWLGEMLDGAVLVNPEPADYNAAMARLDRFADQPITLVDALTAVIGSRLRVPLWAFDRHFATMRAKLWR
jgi:uncharacterized protein